MLYRRCRPNIFYTIPATRAIKLIQLSAVFCFIIFLILTLYFSDVSTTLEFSVQIHTKISAYIFFYSSAAAIKVYGLYNRV